MGSPNTTCPRNPLASSCAAISLAAALALLAATAQPVLACDGDCNDDGEVRIEELITAVAVALGDPPQRCTAADRDGNGRVAIDELIAAVGAALFGCDGDPNLDELRASATVASAPLVTVLDFGFVGAGGAAGVARARQVRPAQSSGCVTFECFLFGEFTGTQDVCCDGTQYSLTSNNCLFDDSDRNVFEQEGSFMLESPTADVCSGVIPFGHSFTAEWSGFFSSVETPSGAFAFSEDDFVEVFTAGEPPPCIPQRAEDFGFAIRGQGVRQLNGTRVVVAGDESGFIASDFQSTLDELLVLSSFQPSGPQCNVAVVLDGDIEVDDALTGSNVLTTFSSFGVGQTRDGDDILLLYQGTLATDCLGDVAVSTTELVRVRSGDPCPVGGSVQLDIDAGSTIVTYTSGGGAELDFGADGSVDERVDRCEEIQVALAECTNPPPAGVCAACDGSEDCADGLACYECAFGCTSSQMRCSFTDDFATCEDGVF